MNDVDDKKNILDNGDNYPIEPFLDEFKSDDYAIRSDCVNNLFSVALAVGLSNFRTKLLPQLSDILKNDDSSLAALADFLGDMTAYIGGVEYVSCLLEPLEQLASHENNEVRKRATSSLIKLIKYHTIKEIENLYMPMFIRMLKSQSVVSNLSACQMAIKLYERSTGSMKKDIRSLVGKASSCGNPLIREEVAKLIGEMIPIVPMMSVCDELFPLFLILSSDSQEFVRKAALLCILPLTVRITTDLREKHIFNVIEKAIAENSEDIKIIMADNLPPLMGTFFDSKSRKTIESLYRNLFHDCNPSVKSTAVLKLPNFLDQLMTDEKDEVLENFILPCIKELINNDLTTIRLSLATVISTISTHMSEEQLDFCIKVFNEVFPIIKKMSRDKSESVREEVMIHLHHINKAETVEAIIENLLPNLVVIAKDNKWKVRLASVGYHGDLALKAGHDMFVEKQHQLFIYWLIDNVAIVRDTCIDHLVLLFKKYGYQLQMSFLPVILQQTRNPHYLVRIACLKLIYKLAPVYLKETIIENILPLLGRMANDAIANVRLNVAKAFMCIAPFVDNIRLIELNVLPYLDKLVDDKDDDVKFFAVDALEAVSKIVKNDEGYELEPFDVNNLLLLD